MIPKKTSVLIRTLAGILRAMPKTAPSYPAFMRVFVAFVQNGTKPVLSESGTILSFQNASGKTEELVFARYVRRKLTLNSSVISDSELAALSNAVEAEIGFAKCEFVLLHGKDILRAYHKKVGGDSCMTERPGHTRLYEENPEHIAMLTLKTDRGRARALVWTTTDGTKILDRIYPGDGGPHIALFYKWAERHGAYIRAYNGAPSTGSIIPFVKDAASARAFSGGQGIGPTEGFEIKLRFPSTDLMPYLDTFHYGIIHDSCVTLFTSPRPIHGLLFFNKTDGSYTLAKICASCKQSFSGEFRLSGGKLVCEACYRKSLICCDVCGRNYPPSGLHKEKISLEGSGKVKACKDCIDFRLFQCDSCQNYGQVSASKTRLHKGTQITVCGTCNTSKANCSKCGALVTKSKLKKLWTESGANDICEDCVSEYSITCTCCGQKALFGGTPAAMKKAIPTFKCSECRRPVPYKINPHIDCIVDVMKV